MSKFEKLVIRALWLILKWIVFEHFHEVDRGYAKETIVEMSKFYQADEEEVNV